jgi:hypothetical protein
MRKRLKKIQFSLFVFAATHVYVKAKRARKVAAPIVQPEDRRFTRSCLKDGYRPAPVVEVQPKKKARGREKLLVVQKEPEESGSTAFTEKNNPSMEEGDLSDLQQHQLIYCGGLDDSWVL